MIFSKMSTLKPLLESNKGQHLTAYIPNDQNIFVLRRQLREVIDTSYEYLAPVMNPDALVRFMAPLHNAIEDSKLLKNLKGNVGIFRNENSFRILCLPVAVEQTCVVATSFHVKPLLRWLQADREFLLLGISDNFASLYLGNQSSLNLIDTIIFPKIQRSNLSLNSYLDLKKSRFSLQTFGKTATWLNDWILDQTKNTKPLFFVAGPKDLTTIFLKECAYKNKSTKSIWPSFAQDQLPLICEEIRSQLKDMIKKDLEKALMEFYQAEDMNLANKNIFQIAKAAIKGKVKKLIIADGINIFGKLDKKTGGLSIHPTHLDHEDDDLLDDLAQQVLSHGGEVLVAPRDEIPKGRPILAILDSPSHSDPIEKYSNSHGTESKIERSIL